MITMDCVELVEQATRYLDGVLDAGIQRRVVEHLAGCDDCRRYVEQVRRTIRLLGELGHSASRRPPSPPAIPA